MNVPPAVCVKFRAKIVVPLEAVNVPACRTKFPVIEAEAPAAKLTVVFALFNVKLGSLAPLGIVKL